MTSPSADAVHTATRAYERALQALQHGDVELVEKLLSGLEPPPPHTTPTSDPRAGALLRARHAELHDALRQACEQTRDELAAIRRGHRTLRRMRGT